MTAIMTVKDQTPATKDDVLSVKARRIKELSASFASNTIALGREFEQAKKKFHRPAGSTASQPFVNSDGETWDDWCKNKAGWASSTAENFIRVSNKFKNDKNLVAKTSTEVLRILSSKSTPDSAIEEVRTRVGRGDTVTKREALRIVKDHKELPTRAQAIKQADETGKLVQARDGKLYSGATEEEMAEYSERRSLIYGMRRAIKDIADCQVSPSDWIKRAESHWLTEFPLSHVDAAIQFLTKLKPLLEKRQGVINGNAR